MMQVGLRMRIGLGARQTLSSAAARGMVWKLTMLIVDAEGDRTPRVIWDRSSQNALSTQDGLVGESPLPCNANYVASSCKLLIPHKIFDPRSALITGILEFVHSILVSTRI